jgi:hypothetical protein
MDWKVGLGPISINHGYGAKNGSLSNEYKSFGIGLGASLGLSFGPSNTKFIKKF